MELVFVVLISSERISPDFPPVTFDMAVSNFAPKRFVPLYEILHQLVFKVASTAQGLSHKALLAIRKPASLLRKI